MKKKKKYPKLTLETKKNVKLSVKLDVSFNHPLGLHNFIEKRIFG